MATQKWDDEVLACRLEVPKFEVKRYSDSSVMAWLKAHVLKWAAATTVGYTVYIKDEYFENDRGAEVLRHEFAHVRDWDRWGAFMTMTYFIVLPVVFTMRAVWEWHGYREDLRSAFEEYGDSPTTDYVCQWVASQFCTVNYGWMFPFRSHMYNKCKAFVKSLS